MLTSHRKQLTPRHHRPTLTLLQATLQPILQPHYSVFLPKKRHNLLTSDLSSVTISTDVRKTDYSPDASTQKQTTHKKLSPDLKTSVSSTTPSPITHGDTTFSSPISHGGDTFNSTPPPPAVRQYPRRRPIQRGTRRLVSMRIRIRVSGMHLTIYLSFSLYLYYS